MTAPIKCQMRSRSERRLSMLKHRRMLAALAFVAFLFAGVTAMAQEQPAGSTERTRAQALLDALQKHGQFLKSESPGTPAVSAAVMRHGRIVFSGGSGRIDLENDVPATGESVYVIGSISKVMT